MHTYVLVAILQSLKVFFYFPDFTGAYSTEHFKLYFPNCLGSDWATCENLFNINEGFDLESNALCDGENLFGF